MGARTESKARGIISTQLYRQLCVATVGGHMRVIHGRAQYVGRSHAMAVAEAERQRKQQHQMLHERQHEVRVGREPRDRGRARLVERRGGRRRRGHRFRGPADLVARLAA